jgi:uncharacterized membrane protein (UPF0127 family)
MLTRPETDLWLGDGMFRIDCCFYSDHQGTGVYPASRSLVAGRALLMVFPSEDKWGIWMKNMNFPIDIVWLNKEKKCCIYKKFHLLMPTTIYKPKSPAYMLLSCQLALLPIKSITVGEMAIFESNIEGTN